MIFSRFAAALIGLLCAMPCALGAEPGTIDFAFGQVSVGATATLVVDHRSLRSSVTIINNGAVDAFCGKSTVTTATGQLLLGTKGSAITVPTQQAIYCIVASGSLTVSFLESF